MPLYIIHIQDRFILSKKEYGSWREIQEEYAGYMTSLGPFDRNELYSYLDSEYGKDWPLSRKVIAVFLENDDETVSDL